MLKSVLFLTKMCFCLYRIRHALNHLEGCTFLRLCTAEHLQFLKLMVYTFLSGEFCLLSWCTEKCGLCGILETERSQVNKYSKLGKLRTPWYIQTSLCLWIRDSQLSVTARKKRLLALVLEIRGCPNILKCKGCTYITLLQTRLHA